MRGQVIHLDPRIVGPVQQRFRQQRMRRRHILLLIALGIATSVIAFRATVLREIGEFLIVSDPLEHADLVYVLAGDFWGSRVLFGAMLGAEHWAPRVILSGGPYQNFYASDLSVDFAVGRGYSRTLFVPVRTEAMSTIEEARAMGAIFRRLGAKRIILVTSNFHSRRAAAAFRLFLPEFDFRMEAAPDPAFDADHWWEHRQQRHLLFREYEKLLGTYLVRFHVASSESLRQTAASWSDR